MSSGRFTQHGSDDLDPNESRQDSAAGHLREHARMAGSVVIDRSAHEASIRAQQEHELRERAIAGLAEAIGK